jgi:F0F1-type ATP synthase membrane subunit c/vacuolar-type H+-ATPase subunit K
MAQIISIYGLVASVIISNNLVEKMALHTAFLQLGAGLAVGLCGLAAGFAIGIIGDAGGEFSRPKYIHPQLFNSLVVWWWVVEGGRGRRRGRVLMLWVCVV